MIIAKVFKDLFERGGRSKSCELVKGAIATRDRINIFGKGQGQLLKIRGAWAALSYVRKSEEGVTLTIAPTTLNKMTVSMNMRFLFYFAIHGNRSALSTYVWDRKNGLVTRQGRL